MPNDRARIGAPDSSPERERGVQSPLARARVLDRRCGPLRLIVALAVLAIHGYQFAVRPLLIGSCKFCPSCSEYAIIALERHGLLRGGALAIRRLLRCRPFGQGGIDPVP